MTLTRTITLFGSSRPQPGEPAYAQAYELGHTLASSGFRVCNGGYGGTMEASAKGAKDAGGMTIGVTCDLFSRSPNPWIDEERRTPRLEERLITLAQLGDGYVVLPGGTGTLLELAYVLETINKGFTKERPIVLLGSHWTPALEPLKAEMREGRIEKWANFIIVAKGPEDAVKRLEFAIGGSSGFR
ncbi:MAG: hypothetical protein A3H45_15460 [Ignavibacteria bacterium RIFCSPLOWO2_02_FULL_55_14]|nr:MAG: hypothetical protein A3H45_15460 [Ignavibacteria bacterium RIFCSPLOWO2_02_FULL_55_14]